MSRWKSRWVKGMGMVMKSEFWESACDVKRCRTSATVKGGFGTRTMSALRERPRRTAGMVAEPGAGDAAAGLHHLLCSFHAVRWQLALQYLDPMHSVNASFPQSINQSVVNHGPSPCLLNQVVSQSLDPMHRVNASFPFESMINHSSPSSSLTY